MYAPPLTADEITTAAGVIRQQTGVTDDPHGQELRFVAISTQESAAPARHAHIITVEPPTGKATEYVVRLVDQTIVSTLELPLGTQPLFTPDDCDLAEQVVQQSPEVAAALEERYGITDMTRVACDPWSIHLACDDDTALTQWRTDGIPGRLVQTFLYYRQDGMADNHYAHPIDILPVVDLNARVVVCIHGMDRPAPKIPTDSVNYHRDLLHNNSYLATKWRSDVPKSLNVLQPEGPSFTVTNDTHVEWQKWSFDIGFNYREGLTLHNMSFDGRPVLNRASLVEMAVPYADPYPPHTRKCAFDVGDYGLGYCANSLQLGCDCLGHIRYFDVVLNDAAGNPVHKPKAICMHEEDQGILWKHVEYRNGYNESRRSRELVISFVATVVNYEYLFYWRLKQDGMIDFEIKLSGELSTNLLSAPESDGRPTHGVLVAPGVNSQIHQHMFCARLDMAVDGVEHNTVREVDIVSRPIDPVSNPYGNVFEPVETLLTTEQAAIRTLDVTKARTWKISSNKTNPINGKLTSYKLVPFSKGAAQPVLMTDPSSAVSKKGSFATSHLWVTPYHPKERFPAGEYTPQGDGSVGLPQWTSRDRSLLDCPEGIVVWHAFGVLHVPRIEDFPVMPCEITGFSLKPDNFFLGNPGIDIPPEVNEASKLDTMACCAAKD
ncbi:primary-amine oxidase [Fistulifera solaris]|uniref:Amine oxidase n=1 Tax=Fistulifera solaris TaxID=1519565 RepID=A0A1Z5KAF3_FISSO|nr:primary-amine oxidase [Fistulifera solaris]|eukprot:GAX22918.1 primary-amine oxidase [Fistulifera solaris]